MDGNNDLHGLKVKALFVLAGWTVLFLVVIYWNVRKDQEIILDLAKQEALTVFNKDQAFRLWATKHGGVYVPVTEETPPNPNLNHVPERDLVTPAGKRLTLMNPAYMLRQVMSDYEQLFDVKGKITSLKVLNPINKPDEWEITALQKFEKGIKEIFEIQYIDDEPHLRLIRPMMTQTGCLKCHGTQGYKEGEVRGGVGVYVPMNPYLDIGRKKIVGDIFLYILFWLLGVVFVGFAHSRSKLRLIDRKNSEQSILMLNKELEQRVAQRTSELTTANEMLARKFEESRLAEEKIQQTLAELERSNKELEHFAYVVSHDLQEPLRMVSSYMQLLARRYQEKLDADANEFIDYAVDGANRMSTMINDLLLYSRVGTRGAPLVPVELETVLQEALDNLQVTIQENNAEITHELLPTVMGDTSQLIQLFQNLIANAVKFRKQDQQLRVSIKAVQDNSVWRFSVADNGIGIAEEHFERIFKIFQRLHSRDEIPGTGIGLSVCRRIVERHGGRIWVESEQGVGSTLFFTLPGTKE